MKKVILLIALVFATISMFSQNKQVVSKSEIKSVIIYNSSAEIIHDASVTIPAGKSTIVFTDLTTFIVENTTNVTCKSSNVDIITVTEKVNYTKEKQKDDAKISSLKDSIKRLERESGLILCQIEALEAEKSRLFRGESIGGVSNGVSVDEIAKASEFFGTKMLSLSTRLFELYEVQSSNKTRIKTYTRQIDQLAVNTVKPIREIYVTIQSSQPQTVGFTFKYLTTKSGWAPSYDFKFKGETTPLELIFRANVFNATGIEWRDVNITLSTANPTVGFSTPSLNSGGSSSQINTVNRDGMEYREMTVINSIEEYDVEHKYNVPTDGKPYLIDVKNFNIDVSSYYLLIPKLDPFGFLMAQIPDWNKYNLIPGTANIYNRGSYMGKTFLNTYAENDTLGLFLGKDNNIQVVRNEDYTSNNNKIIGNYYIDKSETTIKIKNNLPEAVQLKVLDQVPYIYSGKTKFELDNPDQALYVEDEGLLTWDFKIEKSGTKTISFGYQIKTPKNEEAKNYYTSSRKYRSISCPAF